MELMTEDLNLVCNLQTSLKSMALQKQGLSLKSLNKSNGNVVLKCVHSFAMGLSFGDGSPFVVRGARMKVLSLLQGSKIVIAEVLEVEDQDRHLVWMRSVVVEDVLEEHDSMINGILLYEMLDGAFLLLHFSPEAVVTYVLRFSAITYTRQSSFSASMSVARTVPQSELQAACCNCYTLSQCQLMRRFSSAQFCSDLCCTVIDKSLDNAVDSFTQCRMRLKPIKSLLND